MPNTPGTLKAKNGDVSPTRRAVEPWTSPRYRKSAFFVCLSFSNLCFLSAWRQIDSRYFDFFLSPPVKADIALRYLGALLADIFLVALALWGVYLWISRSSSPKAPRIMALGFLYALVVPLNLFRTESGLFSLANPFVLAALCAIGIAVAFWHTLLFRPVAILVMVMWPLLLIQIGSAVTHIFTGSRYTEPVSVSRLPGHAPRRVLWIVFDEFDQYLSFDARPSSVPLPNLERFKMESISATHAHRSARDTLIAIPSLLLGRTVSQVKVGGVDRLSLTMLDGTREPFPDKLDIFSILRNRGINSAISGWYYPYCRLFNDSVSNCFWAPAESCLETIFISMSPPAIGSFFDTMIMFPRNALARFPGIQLLGLKYSTLAYVPIPPRSVHEISEYQAIYSAALRFSSDPDLGLIFLHFPIPHHYSIYKSLTGRLEPGGNYFDNLQLVDKTFDGLRSTMEKAGMWDRTTVLVSTDHSLRYMSEGAPQSTPEKNSNFTPPGSERPVIPFLLKLPGQHEGIRYDAPFNAVLTRDLILSLLSGEISTPEQTVKWLDTNRSRVPLRD